MKQHDQDDEAKFEAYLKDNYQQHDIPNNGFVQSVLQALPPEKEKQLDSQVLLTPDAAHSKRAFPVRSLLCIIAGGLGLFLIDFQFLISGEMNFRVPRITFDFSQTLQALANPDLVLALGVTVASLMFVFGDEIKTALSPRNILHRLL